MLPTGLKLKFKTNPSFLFLSLFYVTFPHKQKLIHSAGRGAEEEGDLGMLPGLCSIRVNGSFPVWLTPYAVKGVSMPTEVGAARPPLFAFSGDSEME